MNYESLETNLIEKLNCALELLAEELSMVKAEKEEVHKEK